MNPERKEYFLDAIDELSEQLEIIKTRFGHNAQTASNVLLCFQIKNVYDQLLFHLEEHSIQVEASVSQLENDPAFRISTKQEWYE